METKELRARWLRAKGDPQAAVDQLAGSSPKSSNEVGEDPPSHAAFSEGWASDDKIASLLEDLAQTASTSETPQSNDASSELFLDTAEKLLRRSAAARPESSALLAAFLVRRKRGAEALAICDELWQGGKTEAAARGYADLAATKQLTAPRLQDIERRLTEAIADKADSMVVQVALAKVCDARGEYGTVAEIYRQVLAKDADQVLALNNLALNLALRNVGGREPLKLIDRAIEVNGPFAALLDTRATVQLALGDAEKAIADLDLAIAEQPAAAYFFHLAQAHLLRNDRASAAAALRRAQEAGLTAQSLHSLERDAYRKVLNEAAAR